MKTMTRLTFALLALAFAVAAAPARAALNIFACVPEWGSLATELGGDKVNVYTATSGMQDPHRVEAKPSLIARARNADLLVCTGADLEIGWLPVVLEQSGNPRIRPGGPGHFLASAHVALLEIPTSVDRSQGDQHPYGNPHIQTDARNIALVGAALAQKMAQLDAANAAFYQSRAESFAQRWTAAVHKWETEAAPLKGVAIVSHHRNLTYLNQWLGMRQVAELEPKPGIEPTTAHLSEVLAQLQSAPAKMVVRTAYLSDRPSDWLAQRAHIPRVVLPFTVGGDEQSKDLFSLFDDTIQRLLAGLKQP